MFEIFGGAMMFGFNLLWFTLLIMIQVIFLVLLSQIAKTKGRNPYLWIFFGVLSPFIAVIVILIATRKYPKMEKDFDDITQLQKKNPMVVAIVGLSSYVANADGNVETKEYDFIYNYLKKNYSVSKRDLKDYQSIIEYTNQNPEMIDRYIGVVDKYTKEKNREYNNLILSVMLCSLATINDQIEESEVEAIKKILLGLRVDPEKLKPMLQDLLNKGIQQKKVDDLVGKL